MPSQLGVWGLSPRKKNQFCAKKICNSEQVLVLSYITAESGDCPPVLKVGDLFPCPPTPTPMGINLKIWDIYIYTILK